MTKKEFMVLAMAMKSVYTMDAFLPTDESLEVWYNLLADLDYGITNKAVMAYMSTNKFPPTIADIREQAGKLKVKVNDSEFPSVAEAWSMYTNALKNGFYGYEEEYAKLPPVVQKTIGSAIELHNFNANDNGDKNMDVERSLFERRYREVCQREREELQMSPLVLGMMKEQKLIGGDHEED